MGLKGNKASGMLFKNTLTTHEEICFISAAGMKKMAWV